MDLFAWRAKLSRLLAVFERIKINAFSLISRWLGPFPDLISSSVFVLFLLFSFFFVWFVCQSNMI